MFAYRGFTGEHDGISTFIHCIGDIGHLGTGWDGVLDHGFQQVGSNYHAFTVTGAKFDDMTLHRGQFRQINFHPQVTTGNHDAVGNLYDFLKVFHALLVFNLGNDLDGGKLFRKIFLDQIAQLQNITGFADKGQGDIIQFV